MKNPAFSLAPRIAWIMLFFAVAWSCTREDAKPALTTAQKIQQANMTAQNNSLLITTAQDVANITSNALVSKGLTGGRVISTGRIQNDGCEPNVTATFKIDTSHPDTLIYSGKLTIDFGDGSTCHDSTEVHKGKLIDAFQLIITRHDSVSFSLTDSITFQGFQKDTVMVDGLFVKNSSARNKSTLDIFDAKLTYPDGTSLSWSGELTIIIGRSNSGGGDDDDNDDNDHPGDSTNVSDGDDGDSTGRFTEYGHDSYVRKVTGSVHGTTRDGVAFTAQITKELVYRYSCSNRIPVSGTIDLTVDGVVSTIDYGDGSCDLKYTITTAGTTTDYTFRRFRW